MKTLNLFILLILGFCISISAQIPMGTDLFIILEKEGDAIIKSTDGSLFDAEPATYLYKGNTLILGTDSYVMLHYGLLTMQLTEAGEYVLNDELFEEVLTDGGDFDPLFADFTAFSIEVLVDAIEFGEWDIDRSNKGDGWGKKVKTDPGAWGKKDQANVGGWGKKDQANVGGWGINPIQSKSGLGVIPPINNGWGKKDQVNTGGWGKKDQANVGGWGKKDQANVGGWGKKDARAKGSWGKKDQANVGGWGKEQMIIEAASPGGLYLPSISNIKWVEEEGVMQYLFVIGDSEENMIYSEISKENEIVFDFAAILEKDKQYFWQVFADGKEAISQPIFFVIKDSNHLEEALKECKNSSNYKKSGNVLKGLMQLYTLEQNNFYLHAYEKYNYLIKKFPDNDLVKINYASFVLRLGQFKNAKSIAEKL